MQRPVTSVALLLCACALASCSATPASIAPTPAPSTSQAAPPASTPTAEPTQSPTPASSHIALSIEGIAQPNGQVLSWSQGRAVMAYLSDVLGAPDTTQLSTPGPDGTTSTQFSWAGVTLWVPEGDGTSYLHITGANPNASFRSPSGIGIGDSQRAVEETGSTRLDVDVPGVELFRDGAREAPGTEALGTPGTGGSDYVEIETDGTTVTRISAPSNDYSDL